MDRGHYRLARRADRPDRCLEILNRSRYRRRREWRRVAERPLSGEKWTVGAYILTMKIVKATSLLILLSVTTTGAFAQEPSLVVVCERGSIEGSRTEIDENGYAIMGDRADFAPITYAFDVPERGMVRISLGTEEIVAPILNEYATYKTVAYTFGGVSYMDTVFFELGKVLSSEHKDLFDAVIATTWRFDCVVER